LTRVITLLTLAAAGSSRTTNASIITAMRLYRSAQGTAATSTFPLLNFSRGTIAAIRVSN